MSAYTLLKAKVFRLQSQAAAIDSEAVMISDNQFMNQQDRLREHDRLMAESARLLHLAEDLEREHHESK